jgi:hypothetical protein
VCFYIIFDPVAFLTKTRGSSLSVHMSETKRRRERETTGWEHSHTADGQYWCCCIVMVPRVTSYLGREYCAHSSRRSEKQSFSKRFHSQWITEEQKICIMWKGKCVIEERR